MLGKLSQRDCGVLAVVWGLAAGLFAVAVFGELPTLVRGVVFLAVFGVFVLWAMASCAKAAAAEPRPAATTAATTAAARAAPAPRPGPQPERKVALDPAPLAAPAPKPAPAPEPGPTPTTAAPKPAPKAAAKPAPALPKQPEPPQALPAQARPTMLGAPRGGVSDDLKRIKGIGPKLEKMLHGMGVHHFDQIAAWTEAELAWVDDNLEGFRGRASRDGWVAQARTLASGGTTEFAARVDAGDVPTSQA